MPSLKLFGIALATGTIIAASGIANAQTTVTTVTAAPTPTNAVTYPPSPRPLMVPATLVQSTGTTQPANAALPVATTTTVTTTTSPAPAPETSSSVTILASKNAPGVVEALPEAGQQAFQTYLGLALPKAFAVDSANKAYGYIGGIGDVQSAELEAMKRCSAVSSAGDCKIISVNEMSTVTMNGNQVTAPDAVNTATETRAKSIAEYTQASGPKALATAPDGSWGWVAQSSSVDEARSQALARCSGWASGCSIVEASTR
jgi:hypothetical protein